MQINILIENKEAAESKSTSNELSIKRQNKVKKPLDKTDSKHDSKPTPLR